MTPRERVLTALDHREPDRVPIDLASCGPTGIHMAFMAWFILPDTWFTSW